MLIIVVPNLNLNLLVPHNSEKGKEESKKHSNEQKKLGNVLQIRLWYTAALNIRRGMNPTHPFTITTLR